jgi:hypothetical protein
VDEGVEIIQWLHFWLATIHECVDMETNRVELVRDWFPIFLEVEVSRLIEISMLMKKAPSRTIKTLQSLYHDIVGYQHTRTRIGLAKMPKFLQMQLTTQVRTRKNMTKL